MFFSTTLENCAKWQNVIILQAFRRYRLRTFCSRSRWGCNAVKGYEGWWQVRMRMSRMLETCYPSFEITLFNPQKTFWRVHKTLVHLWDHAVALDGRSIYFTRHIFRRRYVIIVDDFPISHCLFARETTAIALPLTLWLEMSLHSFIRCCILFCR